MDSQIRKDLPVDIDVVCFKSVNKPAVGQTVRFGGRLDPDDPEASEVPLAGPAVSVGILQRSFDSFLGRAVVAVARSIVSFREF